MEVHSTGGDQREAGEGRADSCECKRVRIVGVKYGTTVQQLGENGSYDAGIEPGAPGSEPHPDSRGVQPARELTPMPGDDYLLGS